MKKRISLAVCLVLLLTLMTGCRRSRDTDVNNDGDMNRPSVNDNVGTDENGMVTEPSVSDHPVTDDTESGMEKAGDAVKKGMEKAGDAVKDATDDLTGKK